MHTLEKKYRLALHIFRRDLRLQDNTALNHALASAKSVVPCFIFDKNQVEKNDYKSENCIQFMAQSLLELDQALEARKSKLYVFYGHAHEIVERLIEFLPIEAIFINRDYTPFSIKRDQKIKQHCDQKGIDFHCYADALLHEPEQVHKSNRQPYTIFTPFFHMASQLHIEPPTKLSGDNFYNGEINFSSRKYLDSYLKLDNANLFVKGGREEGRLLLKQARNLADYQEIRDFPYKNNGTSKLSAHNKFGTVSIREVHAVIAKALGADHPLIRALYWRDFFTHISFHYPKVFGHAFQTRFSNIQWPNNENYFRAWCEGRTGFPIVDAGMRELNTTGFMHNRVRMIVASFLTKDLHIDWRWGEKYFAQKLVDYDPAVNNGNWQWAASTGCDAQPYFRIFNPWLQQAKFDPDCLYIKHWMPELASVPIKTLMNLHQYSVSNYPRPIVEHKEELVKTKALYRN